MPKTCAQLSAACGLASDGCGNVLDCGSCPDGYSCGSQANPYQCVPVGGTGGSGGAGTGGTGGSGGGGACTPGQACNDGNECTQGDTCSSSGQCEAGTPVTCNSAPACYLSTGSCDPVTGTCSYAYQASGIPCTDDGNDCTIDQCDGAGQCVHVNKSNGVPCAGGTCSNGVCSPSCQGGGTVLWSQAQSSWYGNPATAGTYACEGSPPAGSYVHGATVQLTPNDSQRRTGTATATCANGTWQASGSCNGKEADTTINSECSASGSQTRQLIAGWYVADLHRCADTQGLDYWAGAYDNASATICTPASNYDGFGSKEACWRDAFRTSANANGDCYDQAQSTGHLCDADAAFICPQDTHYPWNSITIAGDRCKYGP